MNTRIINSKLFSKIKDKKYRNLFIASQIKTGIPFQIRALRSARNNMTQKDLSDRVSGLTQSVLSRIENGNGEQLTIKTLLKLAEAFDVALVVRFEPIDRFIDWVDNLSPDEIAPPSSEKILTETEYKLESASAIQVTGSVSHIKSLNAPLQRPPKQPMLTDARAVLRGLPTNIGIHRSVPGGGVTGEIKRSTSTQKQKVGVR